MDSQDYVIMAGRVVANGTVFERTAAAVLAQVLCVDPLVGEVLAGQMQLAGTLRCLGKLLKVADPDASEDVDKALAWLRLAERARVARNAVIHEAPFLDDDDKVIGFVRRGGLSELNPAAAEEAVELLLAAIADGLALLPPGAIEWVAELVEE